jgi:opine dehydrogenase
MSKPASASVSSSALSRFLSWPSGGSRLVVTLIGAGNLAHVFAGLMGARTSEFEVNVLSRKAAQIADSMTSQGVAVKMPDGSTITGKVKKVSNDPKDVIPQADFIIITVPSHGRHATMKLIAPHLNRDKSVFVGVMPGMGGFDFIAKQILENNGFNTGAAKGKKPTTGKGSSNVILWGLKDVPYMCAHTVPGKSVTMLGPKTSLYFALSDWNPEAARVGGQLIEKFTSIPTVILDSFLVITLTPGNPIIHPAIMYGMFGPHSQWDGKPLPEKPLFYEEVSELSSYFLQRCDDEVQWIKRAIESGTGINLEPVWPLRLNLKKVYGPLVEDNRTLMKALRTNQAYKTIRTPLKEVPMPGVQGKLGYTVDLQHRFFLEDIPFGLVVLSDLGALLGVQTPMINEILLWAQRLMGKEYLDSAGKLKGKDMKETGAPSVWGIAGLKQLASGAKPGDKKSKL